jgi:hypothetical protein
MAQDFADDRTKPVPGGDVALELDPSGLFRGWRAPLHEAVAASCFALGFNGKRRSRVQRKGQTIEGAERATAQFQLQMDGLFLVPSHDRPGIQHGLDRAPLKIKCMRGSHNVSYNNRL